MTARRQVAASAVRQVERGIRDLEGHLLWAAEVAGSLQAGQNFASRFGWATTDEREDLASGYTDQRLEDSRQMIDRLAQRSSALQTQYENRWQEVKTRLVLGVLLVVAVIVFASTLLLALN